MQYVSRLRYFFTCDIFVGNIWSIAEGIRANKVHSTEDKYVEKNRTLGGNGPYFFYMRLRKEYTEIHVTSVRNLKKKIVHLTLYIPHVGAEGH